MEHIETIIVGAGQAGLSTSYCLKQMDHEHLVLEQLSKPAPVWSNERWDTFSLVTPNLAFNIPGSGLEHLDPNGFMTLQEVRDFFQNYADKNNLPIQFNTKVLSVEPRDQGGFIVKTDGKTYQSENVVIATGLYQKPKIPPVEGIPGDIAQLHSSKYRNPDQISDGAVLIVGSAQSGTQIAEELHEDGRKVFLSTGKAGRVQRRYRGRDIIDWLDTIGFFKLSYDQLPPGTPKFYGIPHISGRRGGYTINLHQFARDGITLLGHIREIRNTTVTIAPDLHENLEFADQFDLHSLNEIDSYIQGNNLELPKQEVALLKDGFEQTIIEELDLRKEKIETIIWANGYIYNYNFVKLPVRDRDGYPVQIGGVTNYKGLYFVGLPWMPTEKSGFLLGVGDHARFIASKITDVLVKH